MRSRAGLTTSSGIACRREGFTAADDTLPPRTLDESIFEHMDSGHPLLALPPTYYKKRGWDEKGVPSA